MIPNYRILTYSPQGLTESFKKYLNKPTTRNNNRLNKDDIAESLLSLFYDANLPFCGTFISWSKNQSFTNILIREKLTKLSCVSQSEHVSIEGIILNFNGIHIGIHGFYPLSDLHRDTFDAEYKKISFLGNDQKVREILTLLYSNVLNSAIEDGNEEGVMISILANEAEMTDLKTAEIVDLISE